MFRKNLTGEQTKTDNIESWDPIGSKKYQQQTNVIDFVI